MAQAESGGGLPGRTGEAEPLPPEPGGILWDSAGDIRMLLALPAALTLQVAHPAVGAGVAEHSVYRTDPWGRGARSLRSVLLWVYGGPAAAEEGRRLRALHRTISGTDTRGRPYRALTPATYAWVHATGFPVFHHCRRYLYGRPYTPEEERRVYAEWLQVGRVLGLREGDMPGSVEEFWPYYRRMLPELEATPVVRDLVDAGLPVPPPDRGPRALLLPLRALWPLLRRPAGHFRRFIILGLLPPDARTTLGLPWTPRQERRLRHLSRCLTLLVPRLPERLRYLPAARRARTAHRATSTGDAPNRPRTAGT
ncbi:oxygenase MpaB family protein [Streptomyces sp. NPDC058045]|uniref:oxygenase MpaB family protein n=1 Tax=Streptomyces sp. NPDC058045 TaxID=3346311 RepID=UPI0036E05777